MVIAIFGGWWQVVEVVELLIPQTRGANGGGAGGHGGSPVGGQMQPQSTGLLWISTIIMVVLVVDSLSNRNFLNLVPTKQLVVSFWIKRFIRSLDLVILRWNTTVDHYHCCYGWWRWRWKQVVAVVLVVLDQTFQDLWCTTAIPAVGLWCW